MAMKYCMTYAGLYANLGDKMIGQVMSGDYDVIRDTGFEKNAQDPADPAEP